MDFLYSRLNRYCHNFLPFAGCFRRYRKPTLSYRI